MSERAGVMTEPIADELLTVEQVAALANLHPANVRAIAKDTSTPLREVRVGRYVRIPRSSYTAWVEWLLTVA